MIIPVPAAILAWWAAARYAPRLRRRTGWRGRLSVFLDSVRLTRHLLERPLLHRLALVGMVLFWSAEMFAVWAGLAAFGFIMNGAALVAGFCTGMVLTRRVAPLAGAGILTVVLTLAIWYSGAPRAVAVAGTYAYRALTLWLPLPAALFTLPGLRQMSKRSLDSRAAASPM